MHHIYTTKAIIIKSISSGEANRFYFLITKDLGFIKASAQGVRLLKSKLKGHLQDFSIVNVSLVKGKEVWRITGSEVVENEILIKNAEKMYVTKNIFSLLLRMLHGEEKNESLFECVDNFYNFLLKNELDKDQLKNIEILTVLRILHHLGYFKNTFPLSVFAGENELSFGTLKDFADKSKEAVREINLMLLETHL
jgi:DNA repair protein RecO (recombination protein O)